MAHAIDSKILVARMEEAAWISLRLLIQKPRLPALQKPLLADMEEQMIRLIAVAAFAFAVTTLAQAMPVAPVHEPDSMITQIAAACGPGMTRRDGVCVARTSVRHARRCARWNGDVCARWH
jgi:hypothetical protein